MNSTVASTSLKRKPNDESTSFHSDVPPLPEIRGEILLQVLTHRSLRRSGEISADFDNERLSELGANVLETAITATLFHRRPLLSGFEILVNLSVYLFMCKLMVCVGTTGQHLMRG